MKDSKKEACVGSLSIPVVMIAKEDGLRIRNILLRGDDDGDGNNNGKNCGDSTSNVKMNITNATVRSIKRDEDELECIICRESLLKGGTIVVTLPSCSHTFHEKCAMGWLVRNDTCPTCRSILPGEDGTVRREHVGTDNGGVTMSNFDGTGSRSGGGNLSHMFG